MATQDPRAEPLRIATLGAAGITPSALIAPVADTEGIEVSVMAARDPDRARTFAAEHGIANVVSDYAEAIASDVDAVYNPLPISLHKKWAIRSMREGKHVLCEKPMALDSGEVEEMAAVADETGMILMEAFHYRYHPLMATVLEIIGSGEIGTLRSLNGVFTAPIIDKSDIRRQYTLGGGATMDLGCYPIHWVRTVAGSEPEVVSAMSTVAADDAGGAAIDETMTADLRFGDITATITCSMHVEAPFEASLEIQGSEGRIEVDNLIAPHIGNTVRVITDAQTTETQIEGPSTYHHQLVAFVDAVRNHEQPLTGPADAIANAKVLDAVYASAGLPPRNPVAEGS